MNILISNDDGIDALGLITLAKTLEKKHNVYVLAPDGERSVTSHTLSLNKGLVIEQRENNYYSCSGYPADCVWLGIHKIFEDIDFDLVISGINRGANLSQDVYYSGTVAAAREGVFNGIKAFAVSMVLDHQNSDAPIYYETAADYVLELLDLGAADLIGDHELLNINVPNLLRSEIKGVEFATLGWINYTKRTSLKDDEHGKTHYYIGGDFGYVSQIEGSDAFITSQAKISLSPLKLLQKVSDTRVKWSDITTN